MAPNFLDLRQRYVHHLVLSRDGPQAYPLFDVETDISGLKESC